MKLLLSLLCLPGVLCSQPPARLASIAGTITDSVTHQGIRKVTLNFARSADYSRTALTDDSGKYEILNVEPGGFSLQFIRAPGYVSPAGQNSKLYQVKEGQQAVLDFALTPLGTISGKVTDSDGDPLRGARVAAMAYTYSNGRKAIETMDAASTDDRGEYRLYNLKPGRYFVVAAMAAMELRGLGLGSLPAGTVFAGAETGYRQQFFSSAPDIAQATAAAVPPGGDIAGIDFRLRSVPIYHIRGKVGGEVGNNQSVVAGGCGPAIPMDDLGHLSAVVRRDGTFDIGVPPGVYCLSHAGLMGRTSPDTDGPLTITDRSVEGLVLQVSTPFRVLGTLEFESSPREVLSAVILEPLYTRARLPVTGGSEGTKLTIQNVTPGDYRVMLGGPRNNYLQSVRYGEEDASDGIIHVRAAGTPLALVVGADPGHLTGTVHRESGEPAGGVTVTIAPSGRSANRFDLLHTVQTNQAGVFVDDAVAPGDYKVFAWGDPDVPMAADRDFRTIFESQAADVTITKDASSQIDTKLIPVDAIRQAKEKW